MQMEQKTVQEKSTEILEAIKAEWDDYPGKFKMAIALCKTTETKLKEEEIPQGKTELVDKVVKVFYCLATHKKVNQLRSVDYAGYMMYLLDKLDVDYQYTVLPSGSVSITSNAKSYGLYADM